MNFENNIYHVVLNDIIKNDKISHAMLFEVDNCDEAMIYIKNFVKSIFCNEDDKKFISSSSSCNKCNICSLIEKDSFPDFIVVSTDSSTIKKQQLIDLQNEMSNKSLLNNKRIYVIKEAEKLNVSSSNSLLKFLEEPEDDIIAILVTKNRYLLLDTIISRCQIFNLKNLNLNMDCYSSKVEEFIDMILRKNDLFINYKYLYENIFVDKINAKQFLINLQKCILLFIEGKNNDKFETIILNRLKEYDNNKLVSLINIIELYVQKLEYNVNFKIWLDSFFSKVMEDIYD